MECDRFKRLDVLCFGISVQWKIHKWNMVDISYTIHHKLIEWKDDQDTNLENYFQIFDMYSNLFYGNDKFCRWVFIQLSDKDMKTLRYLQKKIILDNINFSFRNIIRKWFR